MTATPPDRNLALELVRVTESAALAAGRWVGRGDKIAADQAAVDGMRAMLDSVSMAGVVVIGEGEKDEAPILFNGEPVGDGTGPEVGVAVDMNKIAVGPQGIDAVDIDASPTENVNAVAKAKGVSAREITVVVLERERHEALITELRAAGAKVLLIRDGDVAAAIAAAQSGTGVDMLYGVGGTPEGVISAAALKCGGGGIQGKLWPRDNEERQQLVDAGLDPERVLTTNDLVAGDDVFVAATGVTSGSLLRGVRYLPHGAITDSIVMRSRSGTSRRIEATHLLDKLEVLTGREYR